MAEHTFRVTIRGRFDGLGDDDRAALLAGVGDLDPTRIAFTDEGTLVYDRSLSWFAFRCQVYGDAGDGEAADVADAERAALDALAAHGYGFRDTQSTVTDMSAVPIRRKGRRTG
ncbi:DUF6204 family protein [Streptosporangium sp. NPDC048047]|uniref:DUF6204 family protein n=1 Tax=Streptosporangium sp. NPDC048047 TaxID=3155748 RepID=UPI0034271CBA